MSADFVFTVVHSCSLVHIKFDCSSWTDPRLSSGRLLPWRPCTEARWGKAVELRDLGQQARLALESLSLTDSPCLGVAMVRIGAMQGLRSSWIEWRDEIQDIPVEFAQPEPELHSLLGARPVRPGSVPPCIPIVRALCSEIWELNTTLAPDERPRLRMVLTMIHDEVTPFADALNWDALRCLGLELNELAPQLE